MQKSLRKVLRGGSLKILPKPKTSDPFINCTLTSVGPGPDGAERFWISTLNTVIGPSSLLIDENGVYRRYDWHASRGIRFIYGATPGGLDTVWLGAATGKGTSFIRLTLSTGEWKQYRIPVGHFITSGMVLDRRTKKLFSGVGKAMVSLKTDTEEFVRIYERREMGPDNYHHGHWRNRDGTYGFVMTMPGITYLRWYPMEEKIEWKRLVKDPRHPARDQHLIYNLNYVRNGNLYVPCLGWLDGRSGKLFPHEHPPRVEANWFGTKGRYAFGVRADMLSGDGQFLRWDTHTGEVKALFTQPDVPVQNCTLTRSGQIVTVDLHGLFRRYDAVTGALELTRKIEIKKPHRGNTITPAGKDTIVGTPFICQNFWILNTRTGKGCEAGRAAGLYGQIDNAVNVRSKVYFSAYGGAQLTEYDPDRPANFPRNPRLVAKSDQGQHGAGITTDGRVIWCAFRPKYGTLDGAMIRYDMQTGEASYKNAAIRNEHVVAPVYDAKTRQLVAGTSFLSDGDTAPPICDRCYAVTLDPTNMKVTKKAIAPKGVSSLVNVGPLGKRKWLMHAGTPLFVLDEKRMTLSSADALGPLPVDFREIHYGGVEGLFVLILRDEVRVWDAVKDKCEILALQKPDFIVRSWVHGRCLYCDCGPHVAIFRNVLPRPAST